MSSHFHYSPGLSVANQSQSVFDFSPFILDYRIELLINIRVQKNKKELNPKRPNHSSNASHASSKVALAPPRTAFTSTIALNSLSLNVANNACVCNYRFSHHERTKACIRICKLTQAYYDMCWFLMYNATHKLLVQWLAHF